MTAECPVCGWTTDNPDEKTMEEQKNSVIGHMSRSKGEHEGIGFQKAKQMLWADEEINGTDNSSSDSDADSTDAGDVGDNEQADEYQPENRDDEPEASGNQEDAGIQETPVSGADSGLGLSGDNPFPDQQSPDNPDSTPSEDTNGDGSGIAVLGALVALGLAAFGAVKNSQQNTSEKDVL